MKLSEYFLAIATLWQTRSLLGIGILVFFFAVGCYFGYRISCNHRSEAFVYGAFFLALLIAVGIAETNAPLALMTNPVGVAFFGVIIGAGCNVYARLLRT